MGLHGFNALLSNHCSDERTFLAKHAVRTFCQDGSVIYWHWSFLNRPAQTSDPATRGNKLRPVDIDVGLQNKCLNETFLYDKNVCGSLMVIGGELSKSASEIDEATERLFNFSEYLTPCEILLLEKVRGKLHVYDFERRVGGVQYTPVDPSLSYMKENFVQLYELFSQLGRIVFNCKYEDRDLLLNKVQCYYEQGEYGRCKRVIRGAQGRYTSDKMWLDFYLFLCEYMGGKKAVAYRKLDYILRTKPHLVSNRGFLHDVMGDGKVRQMIGAHYTKAEVDEFQSVVRKENVEHTTFIQQADTLKQYYQRKASPTSGNRSG